MVDVVGPVETEFLEYEFEHLEMIVLLVADHIDEFVKTILLETALCRAEILGHINRSAVATQKKFLVESVGSEVTPD